jgi:hypothetical protein
VLIGTEHKVKCLQLATIGEQLWKHVCVLSESIQWWGEPVRLLQNKRELVCCNLTSESSKVYGIQVSVTRAWRVHGLQMNGLQICRVAANILNKQSRTADKRWSSSLGVWRGANQVTNHSKKPKNWWWAFVNAATNLRDSLNMRNFLNSWGSVSF